MRTHLNWSLETVDGECPVCNAKTVLVIAQARWDNSDDDDEYVQVEDELTGHYCRECQRLVALALNTESH